LEQLLLSHNHFNGSLPSAWRAPELSTLALQYNQFTGEFEAACCARPACMLSVDARLLGRLQRSLLPLSRSTHCFNIVWNWKRKQTWPLRHVAGLAVCSH
jgi:hypothetical protein